MLSLAHVIAKSQSGLGIAENIVTLCLSCHSLFDFGRPEERQEMEWRIEEYLMSKYPDWSRENLVYQRD